MYSIVAGNEQRVVDEVTVQGLLEVMGARVLAASTDWVSMMSLLPSMRSTKETISGCNDMSFSAPVPGTACSVRPPWTRTSPVGLEVLEAGKDLEQVLTSCSELLRGEEVLDDGIAIDPQQVEVAITDARLTPRGAPRTRGAAP